MQEAKTTPVTNNSFRQPLPIDHSSFLYRLWSSLTEPVHPIADPIKLRRSRLLSAILLIVFMIGGLILLIRAVQIPATINDADYLGAAVSLLIVAGLYIYARRGHVQFPAAALIVIMLVLFVGVAFAPDSLTTLLYFAAIPIVLTALFFSMRAVLGVALVAISAPFVLMQFSSHMGTQEVFNAAQFLFLCTGVFVTYVNHTHHLERIRSAELKDAYTRVLASEAELEQRVEQRTTELRQAKEEADLARQHAEEANQVKSQFLASMSHELRTPLNAILTFNELVAMGTFGPVNDEQVDYLQKSVQSGKHLLSLINDVLDITKIQAGMMKLFIESDFDVAAEANSIAVTAEKMLKDKPVKLITQIDPDFPVLTCDKRRVRQVLLNLITNSIKFTEEGTITLSVKRHNGEVLFEIRDTGPGIDQDQQQIIFEPFIQTETGIKHAGGTGLGLPISKKLVEAHGGRLWVESAAGQGAAFYFALPFTTNLTLGEREM
ncbi:MAG: hypothetical protein HY866_10900 [Chloroflexi bacterium]|nr:hypothetical protein [Chloroflexota bacterium]